MRQALITGATISQKFGRTNGRIRFITRKTGFGGVVDMINELKETGKIVHQLRKSPMENLSCRSHRRARQSNAAFDKLIIKKIFLKETNSYALQHNRFCVSVIV